MTRNQLNAALTIARSDADLSKVDTEVLFGYGLKTFKPVVATIEAVAAIIRWDCWMLNGEIDSVAFDNLHRIFRHKVTIA